METGLDLRTPVFGAPYNHSCTRSTLLWEFIYMHIATPYCPPWASHSLKSSLSIRQKYISPLETSSDAPPPSLPGPTRIAIVHTHPSPTHATCALYWVIHPVPQEIYDLWPRAHTHTHKGTPSLFTWIRVQMSHSWTLLVGRKAHLCESQPHSQNREVSSLLTKQGPKE